VVRVVSRLNLSGSVRHFVDGSSMAHGPPIESKVGLMNREKLKPTTLALLVLVAFAIWTLLVLV